MPAYVQCLQILNCLSHQLIIAKPGTIYQELGSVARPEEGFSEGGLRVGLPVVGQRGLERRSLAALLLVHVGAGQK